MSGLICLAIVFFLTVSMIEDAVKSPKSRGATLLLVGWVIAMAVILLLK